MSPRTCTRNRLTTTVVVLGLLLGTASRADAQECYECDDLSESCESVCEGNGGSPVSGYYGSDDGDDIKIDFSTPPGLDLGLELIGNADLTTPVDVAATAQADASAMRSSLSVNVTGPEIAAAMIEQYEQLGRTWGLSLHGTPPPVDGVAVPRDQGGTRPITPVGTPVEHDARGDLSDPVDPLTGEFTVHHIDLSFPGFGVPFTHERVYRSRIDFRGPLGPAWDHTYNQRLIFELDAAGTPPTTGSGYATLATVPNGGTPRSSACGDVLLLSTGLGTTLRFHEMSRVGSNVTYASDASQLTLAGQLSPTGELSWTLTSVSGDVRGFDSKGHLVRWTDVNDVGLRLTWEPSSIGDWRLGTVEDSVGRVIDYDYDAADRVIAVGEPASGLSATYVYGDYGELRVAKRGDGRSERYEYQFGSGERGEWVPEAQLHAACEQSCAVSTESCDAGGGCDELVGDATQACMASCPACASECRDGCTTACDVACGACDPRCEGKCEEPAKQQSIAEYCAAQYVETGAKAGCEACGEVCDRQLRDYCDLTLNCLYVEYDAANQEHWDQNACLDLDSVGDVVDLFEDFFVGFAAGIANVAETIGCWVFEWHCHKPSLESLVTQLCDDHPQQCCESGENCGPNSCNAGQSCSDTCRRTWLGEPLYGPGWQGTECLATNITDECFRSAGWSKSILPNPGDPAYEKLLSCGNASSQVDRYGCQGAMTADCAAECESECRNGANGSPGCEAPCQATCGDYCDAECHVDDCASYCQSLDFAGTCKSTCAEACVDAAHAAGANPGPKYGYEADLDFNLIRIYDGADNLWLENTYGTDIADPNFDTVTYQQYGAFEATMTHVDLAAEANGDVLPPPPDVATLVDSLEEYESVEICPYRCTTPEFDPRDIMVPAGPVVIVFGSDTGNDDGGLVVSGNYVVKSMLPTTLRFDVDPDGTVQASTEARQVATQLFTTSTSTSTSTSTAKLAIGTKYGLVTVAPGSTTLGSSTLALKTSGISKARADLAASGAVTLFHDSTNTLRAYRGHPKSIAAISGGTCTKPFRFKRIAEDRVQLDPPDACTGDLWIAPVASAANPSTGDAYLSASASAISTKMLVPTDLAPKRSGVVWRSWRDGEYRREDAPSDAAEKAALVWAAKLSTKSPALSVPSKFALKSPFFVFHHVDPTWNIPNDFDAPGFDVPPNDADPECDPTLPDAPLRGVGVDAPGPHPTSAVVVTDLHGVTWTLYGDRDGNMIRTVNHGTGAVWSFEHDVSGAVTAIEAPDGARQCLEYDSYGNTTEVLTVPPYIQSNFRPNPVRQVFGYKHTPSRLVAVWDPRDVTKALAKFEYDPKGNLTKSIDANGLATSIALVGGDSPARAMPYSVTDPSGAIHRFVWDTATGTLGTSIVDATSSTPVTSEQVADEAGRTVWASSPLGFVSTASYDGPFLTGTAYLADGRSGVTTYGYDADGKVSSVASGTHQTTFTYDVIGSLIGQRDDALDATAGSQSRCRKMAPGGRLLESVTAEGTRTRYQYDGEGRVVVVEAGDLGESPEAWDDACPAHPSGPSAAGTVATFEYDHAGRLRAITDARGYETTIIVDGLGRPAVISRPDGTTTQLGYDVLGNVSWQSTYAAGANPSYRPPAWGDVGLVAAAEQSVDAAGRLKERRVWHFNDQGTPIGDGYQVTQFSYNDVARTVTVTDEAARVTTYRHDGAGRLVETKLPDGSTVKTDYLDAGRTVRQSYPAMGATRTLVARLTAWGAIATSAVVIGTTEYATAEVSYDQRLRAATSKSATGATSTTTYDAFDRPVTVTSQPGETVTISYDRDNRPTSRVSGVSSHSPEAAWSFQYDALGRTWRTIDPLNAVTETQFEGLTSLPRTVIDPRGTRFTYTWTATGAVAGVVADAITSGTPDVALRFVHDSLGQMTQAVRDDGLNGDDVASWFRYDSLGNVLAEGDNAFGTGATVAHSYDNLGRPVASTLGSYGVTRKFDALDRIERLRVGSDSPDTAIYAYSGLGGPMSRTLKTGVLTSYKYDALGNLTRIADSKGTTKLGTWTWQVPFDSVPRHELLETPSFQASSGYTVDPLARITAEQHGNVAAFSLAETTAFAAANQLAQGALSTPTTYKLTARSSWSERAQAGTTTTFAINARDAYTSVGASAPSYDGAGATIGDGQSTYAYDAFGQLARVQASGLNRTYQRDALGRLIADRDMLAGGAVTRYAYDGLRQTFRKTPANAVDVTIDGAGLDDHLVTLLPGGKRRYLEQDRMGSVVMVTDELGAPIEYLRYSAFGEPAIFAPNGAVRATSAVDNRFGFQGHPHDWTTKLVDFRARHYRPALGRFLTMDPLGLGAGSPNTYGFVDGAPLVFTDPLGLQAEYGRAVRNPDSVSAGLVSTDMLPSLANAIVPNTPSVVDPFVVVDDVDALRSRRVPRSQVVGAINYIDNAYQVRAEGDGWTFRLDTLHFDTAGGGTASVDPMKLDITDGDPVATSYRTVSGVTYPLRDDGTIAYDSSNTPRILSGADAMADQIAQASNDRVAIAEVVANFSSIVALGSVTSRGSPTYGVAGRGYRSSDRVRPPSSDVTTVSMRNASKIIQKGGHGEGLGLTGNWKPSRRLEVQQAVNGHLNSVATEQIVGSYRGNPVTHYLNAQTGMNVMVGPVGNLVGAWRLSAQQLQNVLAHGALQ